MTTASRRARLAAALVSSFCASSVYADTTPQSLPFSQDWSNAALLTTTNDWSAVPGIVGHRGDGLSNAASTDPQTVLGEDATPVLNVAVNQTVFGTSGGLSEFAITNPVVGMQGSGTADAPYLRIAIDTTGKSSITVAYNVRDLDANTDNAAQAVALQYRIGASGAFTNIPAAFVADATEVSLATKVTPVSVALPAETWGQSRVELRIITNDATGADEWVGIDDISITAAGGPPALSLSIDDKAQLEGDSGEATMAFTVSLNGVAPVGGVTFDVATADGTAVSTSDYDGVSSTGVTIPEGQSSVDVLVTVNGDTDVEDTETFTVTISNAVGAELDDAEATGTIQNEDIATLAIHDIQGNGLQSAYDGQVVVTEGIVIAKRFNGIFVQGADADADADPTTSEGIFVFTGTTSPLLTSLDVGDAVQIQATVDEYTPSARPHQRPLTELTNATVTEVSNGNPLPTAVAITESATTLDQFEKYEGMRVALGELTAVSPVEGSINEATAVGTSRGIFYGTLGETARPFREEGLSALDVTPVPVGVTPPVFDNNPERIRIVNDQTGAIPLALDVGAVVTGIVGVMDYDYAIYSVLPDVGASIDVVPGMLPTAVTDPVLGEVTVSGFNMLHFYDTVDDSGGDAILTPAAFAIRVEKAARAICDYLKTPDIIGVVEVENLAALNAVATAINDDTYGVCERNPEYVAYLEMGNDISNINIGFLVSTADIVEGVPRVTVNSVTQIGKTETYLNPGGTSSTLFDRPPLILDATVNNIDGSEYPLTVIGNHLLSLTSVSSLTPRADGWGTDGARARGKRGFQAARTAEIVEGLQDADPTRHIVLLGDFNAFEFNDGYVDSMGIVTGREAAEGTVLRYVDSPLTVPLTNMTSETDADHRYSYSFDGNAQVLDHIIVNQAMLDDVPGVRTEHPRINADFGVDHYGDASLPLRVSDHDPVLLYIPLSVAKVADLAVDVEAGADTVDAAATLSFTVGLENLGPTDAEDVLLVLTSSKPTSSFVATADGFVCDAIDEDTVECAADTLAMGTTSFDVQIVAADYLPGSVTLTAAVQASSDDGTSANDSDSDMTSLTVKSTDLAVTRMPPVSYLVMGTTATASFEVRNRSANASYSPRLTLLITAPGANIVPNVPAGWLCGALMSGSTAVKGSSVAPGTVTWQCAFSGAYAAGRADVIGFTLTPPKSMPITIGASVFSQNPDSRPINNRTTASFSFIRRP